MMIMAESAVALLPTFRQRDWSGQGRASNVRSSPRLSSRRCRQSGRGIGVAGDLSL